MTQQTVRLMAATLVAAFGTGASAAVHYVNLQSTNASPPYTSWASAARGIQEAIDSADPADQVLVADGVYQAGGRVVYGAMSNRVAVTKPITVQSVNGPLSTWIQGYQMPGQTNGASAVRCVYLASNAILIGFTLTGGATLSSGDWDRERSGGGAWCESTNARIENCTIAGNAARAYGGGVYNGTLRNCTISSNSASTGGGAFLSCLTNCTLTGNSASGGGGGASSATLLNCWVHGNSSGFTGGGVAYSSVKNCAIWGNRAQQGGGAYFCDVNNCTITGNRASEVGGGAFIGTVNNSIIYYNRAPADPNHSGYTTSWQFHMNYCDTTPLPLGNGNVGNIDAEPTLASVIHLSSGSPCRQAGWFGYASGADIDGEVWSSPRPAMGCDEYHAGAITGALSVDMEATVTNVSEGFTVDFTADITEHASSSHWDFGDGTIVSNRPYASHSWSAAGNYPVVLRVYNESNPLGVTATVVIHVIAETNYVVLNSSNPVAPYTSWATAATNIQDAVDAAFAGSTILVGNGVYRTGGRLAVDATTNRLAVTKPVSIRSVNGPGLTVIEGYQVPGTTNGVNAIRCVYLSDGAALTGFTITNGAVYGSGSYPSGGTCCDSTNAFITNCVVIGNSGGGTRYGTLQNCMIIGNTGGGASGGTINHCLITRNAGGGSSGSSLNNCVVSFNTASGIDHGSGVSFGRHINCTIVGNTGASAGAYYARLENCIIYWNTGDYADNFYNSTLTNCCSPGFYYFASGNFTNDPGLVDLAGGNLRLRPDSPCINAGNNASVITGSDLDGRPRVAGSMVDVGAYEFQTPGSGISYAWLLQYGLPLDGSADAADPDHDGASNWQEWHAGTGPKEGLSVLKVLAPYRSVYGLIVSWESVPGVMYYLQRSTSLTPQPSFLTLQSNISGETGRTIFYDTGATGAGPFYYRVGVQ